MEPSFRPPGLVSRDASHVVGGFVYQMLRTIARWAELDESSILVCEYGEDIYQENPSQPDGAPAILLEQVKQRRRNVTLRDQDVARALVDFADHFRSSSGKALTFRFSSNAQPGKERSFAFPGDIAGIEAWQAIRNTGLSAQTRKAIVTRLQELLGSYPASWFKGPAKARHKYFIGLVSDRANLLQFLSAVEFSVAGPDHVGLAAEITARLRALGHASSAEDAIRVLHALMFDVLMKLSSGRGLKILTADELAHVASDATSLLVDAGWMNMLLASANQTLASLKTIQAGQIEMQSQLATLQTGVDKLIGFGPSATGYSVELPPLDPPPLAPSVRASRVALVKECGEAIHSGTWLLLRGETGCGKTLLAASLLDAKDPRQRWVSLSDKSSEDMSVHVERQLAAWLATLAGEGVWQAYLLNRLPVGQLVEALAETLDGEGLLVVDDLPDHSLPPRLQALLSHIVATFESYGSNLVTTSHAPPLTVASAAGMSIQEIVVAALDEADIREMLEAAGAPRDFDTDTGLPVIEVATSSHPTLVAMAVSWLSKNGWPSDAGGLLALFAERPLESTQTNAWLSSTKILTDRERELLARLSLMTAPFDRRVVEACARTAPEIPLPGELLARLSGPFLTDVADGQWMVTALLRGIGGTLLAEERKVDVHGAIADELLKTGKVNAEDALEITTHLYGGRRFVRYTLFLIQLMMEIRSRSVARALSWAAHAAAADVHLLGDSGSALSLGFAAQQYRMQVILGENAAPQLSKVRRLIGALPHEGTMNQTMLLSALLSTGVLLDDADPDWALDAAVRAVRLVRGDPETFPAETFEVPFDSIVLIAAFKQRNLGQVGRLFDALASMSADERSAVLGIPEAFESFQTAIDSCWASELEKSPEERDWENLIVFYEGLRSVVNGCGDIDILQYAILRAEAVTLGDYAGRPDDAIAVAAARSGDAQVDFILAYTQGCLIADHRDVALAVDILVEATSYSGESFSYYRLDALRRLAVANARLRNFKPAAQQLLLAIHLTRGDDLVDLDRAELLLELAWVYRGMGGISRQLGCLYAAAQEFAHASRTRNDLRYQEAYLKALYGMPWFWFTTAHPGSIFPNWAGGVGIAPGLFTQRFIPVSGYEPPFGFQTSSLFLMAGLAAAIQEPRLSRAALRSAIALSGDATIPAMVVPTLSSVNARLGQPEEAVRMAVLSWKQGLLSPIPITEDGPSFRIHLWHMVLGPLLGEVASGALQASLVSDVMEAVESADTFEGSKKYWLTVYDYSLSLLESIDERSQPDAIPPELSDQMMPQVLYWLVHSLSSQTDLKRALVDQMSVVAHLYEKSSFHLLPAVTRIMKDFWKDVLDTRSFAIRTPSLHRSLFNSIESDCSATQAGPRLVLWAADALGVRLAHEVTLQMRTWAS